MQTDSNAGASSTWLRATLWWTMPVVVIVVATVCYTCFDRWGIVPEATYTHYDCYDANGTLTGGMVFTGYRMKIGERVFYPRAPAALVVKAVLLLVPATGVGLGWRWLLRRVFGVAARRNTSRAGGSDSR